MLFEETRPETHNARNARQVPNHGTGSLRTIRPRLRLWDGMATCYTDDATIEISV